MNLIVICFLFLAPACASQEIKKTSYTNNDLRKYKIIFLTADKKEIHADEINPGATLSFSLVGSHMINNFLLYQRKIELPSLPVFVTFIPYCYRDDTYHSNADNRAKKIERIITAGDYEISYDCVTACSWLPTMAYKSDKKTWWKGFLQGLVLPVFSGPQPIFGSDLDDIGCPCCTQNKSYDFYAFEKGHKIGKTISITSLLTTIVGLMIKYKTWTRFLILPRR